MVNNGLEVSNILSAQCPQKIRKTNLRLHAWKFPLGEQSGKSQTSLQIEKSRLRVKIVRIKKEKYEFL